jgi:hypothetical protein
MSRWTSYGPGDAPSWGAYSGDANDPRGIGIEWEGEDEDDPGDPGDPGDDWDDDQAAACSSSSMSGV